ncbi:MAG: sulfide/dihydroorotate dehydrogenase-like FAD/NAD-binding protein [Candidatus Margulisiibacteriota bacterium]
MSKLLHKEKLAENITLIKVHSPRIAHAARPGQFVVLRINENGERIPLTIADKNPETGEITIIFQTVGASTRLLESLQVGDEIKNLLGPLGTPAHIEKVGTVAVIGGGVGIAEILPAIAAYRAAGNKVVTIIGARNKDLLILKDRIAKAADDLRQITDDGSSGRKGFVSDILNEMLEGGEVVDLVYAVGPVPMMEVVANITKLHNIKTVVSLNPIMLDATGMCGVCRVIIGGHTKFACVDGPEFDAHLVDFADLKNRLSTFRPEEKIADEHVCRLLSSKG